MFGTRKTSWTGPARVIVHAGFRKTGTTTIQRFLKTNADALPTDLVVSPRTELTRPWRKAVAAHIERPQPRALEKAADGLRASVQSVTAQTLLVSDENLFGQSMVTADGRDIFDLAAEFLPMIEEALAGAQVEFVLYTRKLEPWLRSAWAQGVKRSGVAADYPDWRAALPSLEPEPGLAKVRAALKSPLHVFAMEDDLSGNAPLLGRALYRLAGLDDATLQRLKHPPRANESLPATALSLLLKLNALGLETRDRRRVARVIEESPELFAS